MIGEVVGAYQLQQKLGEGAMGEVFLGQHTQSAQKAAVKVLFPNFSKQGAALSRYFAEVRSTNTFHNPGIATIYDCGTHTNGRAFLCMELLAGRSLAAALADLPIGDTATVVEIGAQIAGVLGAVHGRRMVHRALRPDSVFLTLPMPRPSVKLLDFGIANFTQSVRQSQTGSLLGAPLYMSPEVGRGLTAVDHRADIYSLGCMLFELATGRPPFVRDGVGELIVAHATEAPPSAKDLEPSLHPALDTLLVRMLRKDPAQRPQSMIEVAAALRACLKPVPAPAPLFAPTPDLAASAAVAPLVAPPPLPLPLVAAAVRHPTPPFVPVSPAPHTDSAALPAVRSDSASLAALAAAHPARRLEPTALLAPSEGDAPTTTEQPRHATNSNLRPVQPTALLDPPAAPAVATPLPRKPSSRSVPIAVEPRRKNAGRDWTVVLIVGAALVCVAVLVVILFARRGLHDTPTVKTPAPRRPAPEPFKPPVDEPSAPSNPIVPQPALLPTEPAPNTNEGAGPRHRPHAARPSEPEPHKTTEADEVPPRLTPRGSPKW